MPRRIALWAAPRSRSTVLTRAVEQLPGAVIFDEPFYPPYLQLHGRHHPQNELILSHTDGDLARAIARVTGPLPSGGVFSFQKNLAKNVLPAFVGPWLCRLTHVFLLRHPREIVASYTRIVPSADAHDVGVEDLRRLYLDICRETGEEPLVVHSDDLVERPAPFLRALCGRLGLCYTDDMLAWEAGLEQSQLFLRGPLAPLAEIWYGSVAQSTGFHAPRRDATALSETLEPLVTACMPAYDFLNARCTRLSAHGHLPGAAHDDP